MSKHRAIPASLFHRVLSGGRLVPTLGVLAVLTTSGCVTKTLENGGLEAIPAPSDTTAVGAMAVSPEARALGHRIVRFANTGTAADRAVRRKDAGRRMSAACAANYRTGAEGPAAVGGVVTPRLDGTKDQSSRFWYIQFVCVRDEPATFALQRG
ncbi:MAG: hypothetical protein ACJ79S_15920 [Gemmatimonadaceae bacterium]